MSLLALCGGTRSYEARTGSLINSVFFIAGGEVARPFFKTRTMATKRYIAKSHISISVNTSKGNAHITFSPLTGGNKSAYYTDNEELQKALEAHPRFGKLFRLDPTFQPVK